MKKVRQMADLKVDDMALMEINEAFAAVPLVRLDVWMDKDRAAAKALYKKTNVNGSAIAIAAIRTHRAVPES